MASTSRTSRGDVLGWSWLHPVLAAAAPVLLLAAHNQADMRLESMVRPLLLSMTTALAILLVLRLVLRRFARDRRRAALLLTPLVLLFFSFGHVTRLLSDVRLELGGLVVGPNKLVPLGWVLLAGWAVERAFRLRDTAGVTRVWNAVTLVLVLLPLSQIALGLGRVPRGGFSDDLPVAAAATPARPPDVYCIVLDAYARGDVLRRHYDYDNAPFLSALRERGFYVADESRANYSQTTLSLASALNLDYLDPVLENVEEDSQDRRVLHGALHDSRLLRFLRDRGYRTISYASGFSATEFRRTDHYRRAPGTPSEFELVLYDTTPLPLLLGASWGGKLDRSRPGSVRRGILSTGASAFELHRRRLLFTFDDLPATQDIAGPKMVFAHLLTPHSPFVFGRDGQPREGGSAFLLNEGTPREDKTDEEAQRELTGYRDQLHHVNRLVLAVVDALLERSEGKAVIVLMGDHGPAYLEPLSSLDATGKDIRMAILNAVHLPPPSEGARGPMEPYPWLSPVNTFRMVLNRCFGAGLPLLEDRSWFSTYEMPFRLEEIEAPRAAPIGERTHDR